MAGWSSGRTAISTLPDGVRAGNLQFDGSDYAFDYETFSIELNAVEQCKLKVNDDEEKDARGRAKRKRVRNELENIEGVLGWMCRSTEVAD